MLNRISALLEDADTVNGRTIKQIAASAKVLDEEVLRPLDRPFHAQGGIAVLKGNLAPKGSVVKQAAVNVENMAQMCRVGRHLGEWLASPAARHTCHGLGTAHASHRYSRNAMRSRYRNYSTQNKFLLTRFVTTKVGIFYRIEKILGQKVSRIEGKSLSLSFKRQSK